MVREYDDVDARVQVLSVQSVHQTQNHSVHVRQSFVHLSINQSIMRTGCQSIVKLSTNSRDKIKRLPSYQQRVWSTLVAHRVDVAEVERDEIGDDALGSV